jgi:NADH-dependent peroxiredoxin subunit F
VKARQRFAGIPLGHEFTSLVLALLQVGGVPAQGHRRAVIARSRPARPAEVRNLLLAVLPELPGRRAGAQPDGGAEPEHQHTAIDGALFQDEVEARQIMAVPSVYLNGQPFASRPHGRLTKILAKLDTGAAAREAEKLKAKAPYDVLIVGGGPAGAAAAIYAARKGIRTGLVAERFGGQVLDTMGIENFISVPRPKARSWSQRWKTTSEYDVDVMKLQRADGFPGERRRMVSVALANGATLKSKTVILATGARWRR